MNPEKSVIEAQLINVATGEDMNDTINRINNRIAQVKEQSDKCFTIWMDAYTPTLENLPASDWTTDSLKNEHLQDIFYDTSKEAGSGGRAYRFELNNGVYSWVEITDKDTIAALEQAKQAEDLADSKRRVFVEQPTIDSVYDVGDIWVNANYNDGSTIYKNDELVCITAKTAGMAFSISHWQPTSTATTAYLENLGNQITLAVTDSNEGIEAAKALAQQGINDAATALTKANSAYNLADGANATAIENTTVIQQNKDSITALANKISFDSSGNVTNISTSGLVTTADFADMFSEQVTEDGLVKRADIATFITEDEAGELISNATISADKIDFIGKTTINGNFVVDTSGNVTMNNATVNGTINASAGTIGGLTINGNSLTNEGFDNDAYIVMRNDTNNVFCGIGGNVLPSHTGTRAVARFENEYDGGTEDDLFNSAFGANYAAILSAKNARYNIALAMNGGFIQGAALRTDVITSSKTLSRVNNVAVTLNNSETLTINLPTMYDYDDGHILWVCNQGTYGGTLNAGTNIEDGTTRNSYISSVDDGSKILAYITKGVSRMMFIYCHYLTTTIGGNTYSGCWMRII